MTPRRRARALWEWGKPPSHALPPLNPDTIRDVLDQQHVAHLRFADHLGLSRSYWSQVFNRRRALSPDVRRDLLACRFLKEIPEDRLWERVEESAS